jgi:hypothetical protein
MIEAKISTCTFFFSGVEFIQLQQTVTQIKGRDDVFSIQLQHAEQ